MASGNSEGIGKAQAGKIKKVVLAYSGGLDTSIILKWLQETYGAEVVTFTADLGQGEELEPARAKARMLGIKEENIFIEDLREEFVADYVFPMMRANALYEGVYLLGTSIARPLIAKKQIEIARATGAFGAASTVARRARINCCRGHASNSSGCCASLMRVRRMCRVKMVPAASTSLSRIASISRRCSASITQPPSFSASLANARR